MFMNRLYKLVLSAIFLAAAIVLPFLTGQVQQIGNALCPMHIPILLCGFFCGPWYALVIGLIAPLLRFLLCGMPPLIPIGIPMCFELATYGFVSGMAYRLLPYKKKNVYLSLIIAMLAGRVVWGLAYFVLMKMNWTSFGMAAFISGAFLNAIPGIIIQLILIPLLVIKLKKISRNDS